MYFLRRHKQDFVDVLDLFLIRLQSAYKLILNRIDKYNTYNADTADT